MATVIARDMIAAEAAWRAAHAGIAHARARGRSVVVAVADPGGNLVALLRDDMAFPASVGIAADKAYTAAVFGCSTDELAAATADREVLRHGLALRPRVVLFGGGLPVLLYGKVVGGVGVSGGSEDDDRACAAAALAALEETSAPAPVLKQGTPT